MSMKAARAFMTKLKDDAGFRNRLAQAPSPEHGGKMVKEAGFDFTHKEIKAAAEELSSDELNRVAGGMDIKLKVINEANDSNQSEFIIFQKNEV